MSHQNLTMEKWPKMSLALQMGNVGAEVNRAIHWQKLKNKENKESALWRALELIDLTIEVRQSGELFRLREIICDYFLGENKYGLSSDQLKSYFLQFALYANNQNNKK